ncbi:terminase large subunit [Cohaesibacter gelatinilyticus]|nr:terminase TerL endonuclease subunit [Cohaesibacter gelatinilyticus]
MMMRATTRQQSTSSDPVSDYALGVVDGVYPAGPYVRGICQRHLDDLERGGDLWFDLEAADYAIGFFEDVLTVEKDNETVPFHLEPWQAFVVGSLFGWMKGDERRFNTAYIETGKGSGKSPLAAGVGLLCMVADGVKRAEVYAAATKKDQAMILFRDAVSMRASSRHLQKEIGTSGNNPVWQMFHTPSMSFFKPISKEDGNSGPRPNCALIDEYHEHKTDEVLSMLEKGFKFRKSPLLFVITNSGSDLKSPCGLEHQRACRVSLGQLNEGEEEAADRYFPYVASLDKDDDPLNDPSCWPKANPTLGVTIKETYLAKQVAEARSMPSKQNKVLRLNFCRWTDAENAWITTEAWKAVEDDELTIGDFVGKPCYGGLDLSYTQDLTALAWVFPEEDKLHAFVQFYKPKDVLKEHSERDTAFYVDWAEQGFITPTVGKVIKLKPIAQDIGDAVDDYDVQCIAYDKYRHRELADDANDLGVAAPWTEHPQGFRRASTTDEFGKRVENPLWMPKSFEQLENAIIEKRLIVHVNPVLRWNVTSAVVREDPAGTDNRIFDKRKSLARIDGVVALAMAVGAANAGTLSSGPSVYEERGALVI